MKCIDYDMHINLHHNQKSAYLVSLVTRYVPDLSLRSEARNSNGLALSQGTITIAFNLLYNLITLLLL